jgi:chromosome segregation ATPase
MDIPPPPPPPLHQHQHQQLPTQQLFTMLSILGYPTTIPIPEETIPLVGQILNDLIRTVEKKKLDEEILREKLKTAEEDNVILLKEMGELLRPSNNNNNKENDTNDTSSSSLNNNNNNNNDSVIEDLRKRIEHLQDALVLANNTNNPILTTEETIQNQSIMKLLTETIEFSKRLELEIERYRDSRIPLQQECQRLASVAAEYATKNASLQTEKNVTNQLIESLQADVRRYMQDSEEQHRKRRELEDRINETHLEEAKLEGTRNGLQTLLENTTRQYEALINEKKHLEEAFRRSQEETRSLEEILQMERQNHKKIETRIQAQEEAFQTQQQELEKSLQKATNAEADKLNMEQKLSAMRRQLQAQSQALGERDSELQRVRMECETMKNDLVTANKRVNDAKVELQAATRDVSNMTRENQSVNLTCETLRRERDAFKAKLDEMTSRCQRLTDMINTIKLERDDLLRVYRQTCDENAHAQASLKELASSRAAAVEDARIASEAVSEMKRRLAEADGENRRLGLDAENLERRITSLSKELRDAKTTIIELQDKEKTLQNKMKQTVEAISTTSKTRESTSWELAQARNELARVLDAKEKLEEQNQILAKQLAEKGIGTGGGGGGAGAAINVSSVRRTPLQTTTQFPSSASSVRTGSNIKQTPPSNPIKEEGSSSVKSNDQLPIGTTTTTNTTNDPDVVNRKYGDLERIMGDEFSQSSILLRESANERRRTVMSSSGGGGGGNRTSTIAVTPSSTSASKPSNNNNNNTTPFQ